MAHPMSLSSRLSSWLVFAAVLGGTSAMRPAPASACGTCICEPVRLFGPGFVRENAPLNIRLLVSGALLDGLRLRRGDVELAVNLDPAGDEAGSMWLTPREPLEPLSEYILESSASWQTFVTGSVTDVTPPTFDVLTVGAELGNRAGHCGVTVGGGVALSGYSDDTAVGGTVPVQVDLESAAGSRRLFVPLQAILSMQEEAFGRFDDPAAPADCFGASRFADAVEGQTYDVMLTVYDWAGNPTVVSGLTLTASRVLPGGCGTPPPPTTFAEAAGCAVGGMHGDAPSGFAVAALTASVWVWRRGRARRRPRD